MNNKEEVVLFYEREWYMLSNFAAFAFIYNGRTWMTSEHAYQAAKFDDESIVALIHGAPLPHDAKMIAHAHKNKMKPNWGDVKVGVMEEIVRAKVIQHPYVQKKLLETATRDIVEDSPDDTFWGSGKDGNGRNELGKILMNIREEIRTSGCA